MSQNDAGPYWGASGGSDYARAFSTGIVCKVCGQPVPPQEVRRGLPKEYCSPACRARASRERQGRLEFTVPISDKRTRAQKVLDRLKQGPATGLELLKAGGGTRYGARIHQLREKGCHIHGPVEVVIWDRDGVLVKLEAIPKTEDGWDQYELREE